MIDLIAQIPSWIAPTVTAAVLVLKIADIGIKWRNRKESGITTARATMEAISSVVGSALAAATVVTAFTISTYITNDITNNIQNVSNTTATLTENVTNMRTDDLSRVNDRLDAVEAQTATAAKASHLDEVESRIQAIVTSLEGRIETVSGALDEVSELVDGIDERVLSSLAGDIETIMQHIENLEAVLAQFAQVSEIRNEIGELRVQLAMIISALSELSLRPVGFQESLEEAIAIAEEADGSFDKVDLDAFLYEHFADLEGGDGTVFFSFGDYHIEMSFRNRATGAVTRFGDGSFS